MNEGYVKELNKISTNDNLVRQKASELVTDYTFKRETIEYAITNFLQAVDAYYDDFDPNKIVYITKMDDVDLYLCFDVENLAHILGLPDYKVLYEARIINDIIANQNANNRLSSKNWINVFKNIFSNKKDVIIAHDSDENNVNDPKLNWDKIAEKVFCFLNLGIISHGQTIVYREDVKRGTEKNYVLVRNVITDKTVGKIMMQFVKEKVKGKLVFTPVSIIFRENNMEKMKNIRMNGKNYIFKGPLKFEEEVKEDTICQ